MPGSDRQRAHQKEAQRRHKRCNKKKSTTQKNDREANATDSAWITRRSTQREAKRGTEELVGLQSRQEAHQKQSLRLQLLRPQRTRAPAKQTKQQRSATARATVAQLHTLSKETTEHEACQWGKGCTQTKAWQDNRTSNENRTFLSLSISRRLRSLLRS